MGARFIVNSNGSTTNESSVYILLFYYYPVAGTVSVILFYFSYNRENVGARCGHGSA